MAPKLYMIDMKVNKFHRESKQDQLHMMQSNIIKEFWTQLSSVVLKNQLQEDRRDQNEITEQFANTGCLLIIFSKGISKMHQVSICSTIQHNPQDFWRIKQITLLIATSNINLVCTPAKSLYNLHYLSTLTQLLQAAELHSQETRGKEIKNDLAEYI